MRRDRDECAARFMDELREWGDNAAVIGDLSAYDPEATVLEAVRRNLRSIMANMAYREEEAEEVCGTVRRGDGDDPSVVFDAPPRVVAYLDAVREQDFERAGLLLRSREG